MRKIKRKLKRGDLRLSSFGHGILGGLFGSILTFLLLVGLFTFPTKYALLNLINLSNNLLSILAIIVWFLCVDAKDDWKDDGWKVIGVFLALPLYCLIGIAIVYGIPALYTALLNKMFEKVE